VRSGVAGLGNDVLRLDDLLDPGPARIVGDTPVIRLIPVMLCTVPS
jgi:hypothetical protein